MSKPNAISQLTLGKKTSLCIFGDTGVGKTRLIGERGARTLLVRPPTDNVDSIRKPGAEEWVVDDHAGLLEVMEFARHEGGKYFDWIWWDGISLWDEYGLDDVFQAAIDRNPDRRKFGPDKGEYGINMGRISEFLRTMHGCAQVGQFNFGVTAIPRDIIISEDPEADRKLRPMIRGKDMSKKLMAYMNVVLFYEVVKQGGKFHRVLRSQPTDRYDAKDQLDALTPTGNKMVDPTWEKLESAIEKARKNLAGKSQRRTGKAPVRRSTTKRR